MVLDDDPTPPMRSTRPRLDAEVIDIRARILEGGSVPNTSHLTRILDLGGRSEPRRQPPHPGDPGPDAA